MSVRVISLYSGSSGNSFLICDGESRILIDGGKNCRRLCASLSACGISPEEIDAVFVTHTHSDHISALPKFAEVCPAPIHLSEEGVGKFEKTPEIFPSLCPHPREFVVQVGKFTVTSFPTPHDEEGSVGYRITTGAGDVGYATDIGYVSKEVRQGLSGCRAVILESNHDIAMLREGPYPAFLKQRILSKKGHLPNTECAEFAAELCAMGTEQIMLAHLSRENNTPELAFDCTYSAIADDRVRLLLADPNEITEMVLEDRGC